MKFRRGWIIAAVALLVVIPLLVVGIWLIVRERAAAVESYVPPKPEAPPDLAKLRTTFTAGLDALHRKDGVKASQQLGSFTFGGRAVEEYRLFYLAAAQELANDALGRRVTLARLWVRDPKLAMRDDAGEALGTLYEDGGDWTNAASVYDAIADHSATPENASAARAGVIQASFALGDAGTLLDTARQLAIRNPLQEDARDAIAIVRALTGVPPQASIHLTAAERFERGLSLLRGGEPVDALD